MAEWICIRPVLEYGALITGALTGTQVKNMQIFQNKCLRLALGITYQDGTRTIDLHDLTKVPMIKIRMTALAVKTFRSLKNSVLRNWCWTMRSFKNNQALIQFWINCWLQSRLTLKHGWRLMDKGWAPIPTENRGSGEPFCVTPLHETKNTVDGYRLNSWTPVPTESRGSERSRIVWHMRQWALYHSTARGRVWS